MKVLNAAGLFAAMIRPQHARFLIVDSSIRSWLLACNVTPANHSADGSGFVPPDLDLLKGPRVKRGPLFSPTRFAEVERQAVSATQRNPNGKERWTRGLQACLLRARQPAPSPDPNGAVLGPKRSGCPRLGFVIL